MENKMEQEPKEERRISKREKKGSAKYKDFALDTNPLDIESIIIPAKCNTCKKNVIKGRKCDACEAWECQECDPLDSNKERKINAALKIKGIFWNCRDCEDQIKNDKNKGCIHCNEENDEFYMNCDYCNAWKCEKCLTTKEKLNKTQCNDIRTKTSDKAGLQLSWACSNCSNKKETRKEMIEGGKEARKNMQLEKKIKELTGEAKKLEEEIEKRKENLEQLAAEKREENTEEEETKARKR